MKRWKTVVGRLGTVLIAVGLALLLISFIPGIQSSSTKGRTIVRPERFMIVFSPGTITPQQEVQASVTVEGKLDIYLLEVDADLHFINGTFDYAFNLTDLQEILQEHPEQIKREQRVEDSSYELNFTPLKIMNATVVVYNQGSENAEMEYDISLKTSLAPSGKLQTIACFAAPIGSIMAIPWLLDIWKGRKKKITHIE
ncbi:MAG: hypothetical protein CW716_12695 [Candidatus Bathyarchaeum sp.]|nr:MAG: hypothetical protein CW716_12695 [Candidatus Bathyarchaeum sp.]